MNRKKYFSSVLFASLVFSMLPPIASAISLSDIAGNKNQIAIQYLLDHGVISGYPDGTFKPNNTVNRAELLKILVGGQGVTPTVIDSKNCFPDVATEWFAPYVCYAKAHGWVSGYPDGTFQPNKTVSSVEAIKMLVNSQEYQVPNSVTTSSFTDVDVNQWYAPFIQVAQQKGLLEQTGDVFGVLGTMTRGGISENIYRAMIIKAQGLTSFTDYKPQTSVVPAVTQQVTVTLPPSTQQTTSVPTQTITPVNPAALASFTIAGQGQASPVLFNLQQGLAVFSMNYNGNDTFIVDLKDSSGNKISNLANGARSTSQSFAAKIPSNGNYTVTVQATFPWTINVTQPRPTSLVTTSPTIKTTSLNFSGGIGSEATAIFSLPAGANTFIINHQGQGTFIMDLLDTNGNEVQNFANTVGTFGGSPIVTVPTNTNYLLNVQASGIWNVNVEKPTPSSSAAAKLCQDNPDWTVDDCNRVANNEIWIGMSLDMLKVEKGDPTAVTPSNYGSGVQYQWCWSSNSTMQCFYGGSDGVITSYN